MIKLLNKKMLFVIIVIIFVVYHHNLISIAANAKIKGNSNIYAVFGNNVGKEPLAMTIFVIRKHNGACEARVVSGSFRNDIIYIRAMKHCKKGSYVFGFYGNHFFKPVKNRRLFKWKK